MHIPGNLAGLFQMVFHFGLYLIVMDSEEYGSRSCLRLSSEDATGGPATLRLCLMVMLGWSAYRTVRR